MFRDVFVNGRLYEGYGGKAGMVPFRMNENGEVEVLVGFPGQSKRQKEGDPRDIPFWQNRWSVFKGGIDDNEGFEEGAIREFMEETGVTEDMIPSNITPLVNGRWNNSPFMCYGFDCTGDERYDTYPFHANLVDDYYAIMDNDGVPYPEMEKFEWRTVDQLGGMKDAELLQVQKAVEICMQLHANDNDNNKELETENRKMKNVTRLTESQLYRIVEGCVNDIVYTEKPKYTSDSLLNREGSRLAKKRQGNKPSFRIGSDKGRRKQTGMVKRITESQLHEMIRRCVNEAMDGRGEYTNHDTGNHEPTYNTRRPKNKAFDPSQSPDGRGEYTNHDTGSHEPTYNTRQVPNKRKR